jgi:hypothetical protein
MHGGYMYDTVPNATSNWSASFPNRFVGKTMWVTRNADYKAWTENGYFQGAAANGTYKDTFYYAYGKVDTSGNVTEYGEAYINITPTIGSGHHHHTTYLGDSIGYWRMTLDNNSATNWDVYGWAGDGRMDVGVESNNALSYITNTSTSPTNTSGLQYYEDSSWHSWTSSATKIVNDYWNIGVQTDFVNSSHTGATFWR